MALRQQTLGQQLLGAAAQLNVEQGVVGVLDLGVTEPAQPQLHHGPVVQDLGQGVRVGDGVLQVRHEHQVSGLEPHVVNSVVVNVAQNGAGSANGRSNPWRTRTCTTCP